MYFRDLESTDANVLEMFYKDSIGRNYEVLNFVNLLNSIDGNCSISVDALWGAGKTFFVKQVKLVLDAINPNTDFISEEARNKVLEACNNTGVKQLVGYKQQLTVYYDAWENDNDEDPILSLVHSILSQNIDSEVTFKKNEILNFISLIAEKATGKQFASYLEALKQEDYLESIKNEKSIKETVDEFLNSLLEEKADRLVIIIDELDRCRPDYAVRLLERIKHYFSNEKITFVFAINSEQLQHTIRKYYGEGFDSSRYLDRFFDVSILLPPADMRRFYSVFGLMDNRHIFNIICETVINKFNMQMRERIRFLNVVNMAVYQIVEKNRYSPSFNDEKARFFCTMLLSPLLIGMKMMNKTEFYRFITGDGEDLILYILTDKTRQLFLMEYLLTYQETFVENSHERDKKVVSYEDKLREVYNALFKQDYTNIRDYKIGAMTFDADSKNDLLKTISALNIYSEFSN